MRIAPIAGFICTALVVAGSAWAENVTYVSQGKALFNFDAPDGWIVNEGFEVAPDEMPAGQTPAPRIISAIAPDEDAVMWTGFWSPDRVTKIANAPDYLRDAIPRLLAEPKNLHTESRTVDGKAARIYSGIGFRDGRNFDYVIGVVQVSSNRLAMTAFIGEPSVFDKHETQLGDVFRSIRPGRAK